MILPTEIAPAETALVHEIELPCGLIGLTHLRRFEVTDLRSGWPFVNLRSIGDEELNFLALEPYDAIPDYAIEVSDEDAEFLEITSPEDAQIFNIVTVHSQVPKHVTTNLIGPIVVNRRTLIGKQIIVTNSDRYSTLYPLADERSAETAA